MRRLRLLVLASACTLLLGVPAASADPVTISSGFLRVTGVQDVTSRGFLRSIYYDFTFDGHRLSWGEGDGIVQTVLAPRLPSPADFSSIDGTGAMVGVSSLMSINATPIDGGSSPFSLTGHLQLFDRLTGSLLFDRAITGAGTATWQFVTTPTGGRVLSGATYEFDDAAATPEPATMMLLGSGLAGLLAVRRRRTLRQ